MLLKIPGYELQTDLRKDREDTRNGIGGGLLVYAKIGVNIVTIDNAVEFNQYCTFKVGEKKEELQIYLVYRSPNASEEQTDKLVELVKMAGKSSLLIGDFNLPAINWKDGTAAGPTARKFLKASQDADMDHAAGHISHTC